MYLIESHSVTDWKSYELWITRKLRLEKTNEKVIINPGFTIVTTLDEVIEVMNKMFDLRK